MKKLLVTALAALSFFGLTLNAQAEGEPPRFEGIYGGLFAAYGIMDGTFVYNGMARPDFDLNGPGAGVNGGVNWTNDMWLWGLEADGQTLGMQDTDTCNGGCNVTVETDGVVTARARVGVLFGEDRQMAAYATGGAALVWLGIRNNGGAGETTQPAETTFAVGGGVEGYLFGTDWMSTKLEYLYVGVDLTKRGVTVNTGDRGDFGFEGLHLIRWGLNIHFN